VTTVIAELTGLIAIPPSFQFLQELYSVLNTNSFSVEVDTERDDRWRYSGGSSAALLSFGSFFNHSCVPNVEYFADLSKPNEISFQFQALQDIEDGQQLFIPYIDTSLSSKERKAALNSYGFVCSCPRCS
jgi:SET domain-containing protein